MGVVVHTIDMADRGFLTSYQACVLLGVSRSYLERLVQMGKFSIIAFGGSRHGRTRYYRREELERYKEEHPNLGKSVRRVG